MMTVFNVAKKQLKTKKTLEIEYNSSKELKAIEERIKEVIKARFLEWYCFEPAYIAFYPNMRKLHNNIDSVYIEPSTINDYIGIVQINYLGYTTIKKERGKQWAEKETS